MLDYDDWVLRVLCGGSYERIAYGLERNGNGEGVSAVGFGVDELGYHGVTGEGGAVLC